MATTTSILVDSPAGKFVTLDVHYPATDTPPPVAVFFHGFKGFKDWGLWPLIGEAFAEAGVAFVRCNFSHNGTTPAYPEDFADLEAFGHNNYTKELLDIRAVLDWLWRPDTQARFPVDLDRLTLLGHSRGGGVALVAAKEDARIRRVATWASVNRLDFLWHGKPTLVEEWRKNGVYFIANARTGQQMPLYFQLYEDFTAHQDRFDLQAVLREFAKPLLILHGEADTSVPPAAAYQLQTWYPRAELRLLDSADHVFGGRHPWTDPDLPAPARELVRESLRFCGQ